MHNYKYFILYALVILVIGLAFLALRWPQGVMKTFSQHAAAQKITIYYYLILFLLVLPFIYLFFDNYLIQHLRLHPSVLYFVAVASIAQIVCTAVPETGGRKTAIHQGFAGLSALLLTVILGYLLFGHTVDLAGKAITAVCLAVMLCTILLIAVKRNKPLPGMLVQIGYFAAFFIAILSVTF